MAGFQKNEALTSENYWLTEAEQVGREIERDAKREGDTVNVTLGEERATILRQLERVKRNMEEIQTHTWVEPVISGRMDLTARWQLSFTGPVRCLSSHSNWSLSLFNLTFRRMQQAIAHSSTAGSQTHIILLGMTRHGLVFVSGWWIKKWNNTTISMNSRTFRWCDDECCRIRGKEFMTVDSTGEAW